MARTAAAVALATVPERVSVLETKVDNIEEKLDDIKVDVKDMHDCLDRTRDEVLAHIARSRAADWHVRDCGADASRRRLSLARRALVRRRARHPCQAALARLAHARRPRHDARV